VPQATLISTTHGYLEEQDSIFRVSVTHRVIYLELQLYHF